MQRGPPPTNSASRRTTRAMAADAAKSTSDSIVQTEQILASPQPGRRGRRRGTTTWIPISSDQTTLIAARHGGLGRKTVRQRSSNTQFKIRMTRPIIQVFQSYLML